MLGRKKNNEILFNLLSNVACTLGTLMTNPKRFNKFMEFTE